MGNQRRHPQVASWYTDYLWSDKWREFKGWVVEARGLQCQDCKERPHNTLHHTTYARLGNEHLSDVRLLCSKCHTIAHRSHDTPYLFLIYREDYDREVAPILEESRGAARLKYPRPRVINR